MSQTQVETLLVLSEQPVEVRAASALQSAARALGHTEGCCIVLLADAPDLKRFVFEADPWAVLAIDDASIDALRAAFNLEREAFSADSPINLFGYQFVAVPNFSACLDDQDAKRVAWQRMKAAAHPGNPLG